MQPALRHATNRYGASQEVRTTFLRTTMGRTPEAPLAERRVALPHTRLRRTAIEAQGVARQHRQTGGKPARTAKARL